MSDAASAQITPNANENQDFVEEDDSSLDVVVLDGLVMLKIMKHCKENLPELVTGQLLGLDFDSTLEVTNCFPFPSKIGEDDEDSDGGNLGGAEYQIEMMRCLREVNVDNNTVGWYVCSTYMGSFMNYSALETQFNYQERIRKCVMVIYDPLKTSRGSLALKAYRLTPSFMELFKSQTFTKESFAKSKISFNDIFEEIPIKIQNSSLAKAFLFELSESEPPTSDFERLNLSSSPFLERNLEFINECLDELGSEQNKFQYYQRGVQRQQAQQSNWLQKRRAENAQRKQNKQSLLPETDPSNPIFKPIPEPSRLDALLVTAQINHYCQQINQFAGTSLSKVFLASELQKE